MPEVVLIDSGNFQEYILDNISQLKKFGINITVICDTEFIKHFKDVNIIDTASLDVETFNKNNKLDTEFRGGFWSLASKRLFYLFAYMKQHNKQNIFHIENDVMIYHSLENLITDESKLWITMDSSSRCIPGIIFAPSHTVLENLINSYDFSKNDMDNLAMFYHRNTNICRTLPIIVKNSNFPYDSIFNEDGYSGIFDAAAIGQYLGGVDPRNIAGDTRGFINETCVVNYSKYEIFWKLINDLKIPYIKIEDKEYPIFNLHIHCKRLHDFMSF